MADSKDKGLESYLNKVAEIFNEHKHELEDDFAEAETEVIEPVSFDEAEDLYAGYSSESLEDFAAQLDEVAVDGDELVAGGSESVDEPADAYDGIAALYDVDDAPYGEEDAVLSGNYYMTQTGLDFDPSYGAAIQDGNPQREGYDECDAVLAEAHDLLSGDSAVSFIEEEFSEEDLDAMMDSPVRISGEPLIAEVAFGVEEEIADGGELASQGEIVGSAEDAEDVIEEPVMEADIELIDDDGFLDEFDDEFDEDFDFADDEFDLLFEEERELDAQLDKLGELVSNTAEPIEPIADDINALVADDEEGTSDFEQPYLFDPEAETVDVEPEGITQAPTLADEVTLGEPIEEDYASELEYGEEDISVEVEPDSPEPISLEEAEAEGESVLVEATAEEDIELVIEDDVEIGEVIENVIVEESEEEDVAPDSELVIDEDDVEEVAGEVEPEDELIVEHVAEEGTPEAIEELASEVEAEAEVESEIAANEGEADEPELPDEAKPTPVPVADDDLMGGAIVPEDVLKDAEEALGEDLTALAETIDNDTFDPEIASAQAIMSTRTFCDDMHYFPEEDEVKVSGLGDADQAYTYAKIPAIYDARGQEICLGDEMAYRNDFYEIGPVIGIGEDCFFTMSLSTDTRKKDSYGEREKAQWFLHEKDGTPREFYHYNPDSIERINALIYNTDYDMDELVSRFRLFASKERRLQDEKRNFSDR